ncbi:chorismate mutase [Antrihabitans cavernicola]|uniref:Chorismate mutase n=1 Tax=Antrihabitans cavernicola TaxID=2495913 RepID=A0A5A7SBT1_9NOCA|nr:chorismate mutase [Spelaeibacter cavernicola]KAA0022053.1 chorismate mutase [Spelaeibacter cavernicola]
MTITAHAPIVGITSETSGSDELDLQQMRADIDSLDAEILANVRRRVELTRSLGTSRVHSGRPRVAQHAEMDTLARFENHLGRDGVALGMLLIRLGRTGLPGRVH